LKNFDPKNILPTWIYKVTKEKRKKKEKERVLVEKKNRRP
jgi:hypothetical protein